MTSKIEQMRIENVFKMTIEDILNIIKKNKKIIKPLHQDEMSFTVSFGQDVWERGDGKKISYGTFLDISIPTKYKFTLKMMKKQLELEKKIKKIFHADKCYFIIDSLADDEETEENEWLIEYRWR